MTDNEREGKAGKATEPASETDAALEEELRREAAEGKGLIGDEAKNRNLTGSSTWETLPDPSATEE
jgi:hypothetical protein